MTLMPEPLPEYAELRLPSGLLAPAIGHDDYLIINKRKMESP